MTSQMVSLSISEDTSLMKISFSIVIRIMALVLVILFFVPTFVVSCEGNGYTASYEANISPFNIATGNITVTSSDPDEDTSTYTEDIEAKPQYFCLLALLLVVALLGKRLPVLGMLLTTLYIGTFMQMEGDVVQYLNSEYEGYVSVEVTKAGIFNTTLASWIVYVLLASLIVGIVKKHKAKTNKSGSRENNITYCPSCGHESVEKKPFCAKCGAKLETETAVLENNSDKIVYCNNCGNKVDGRKSFCGHCGYNLKQTETSSEMIGNDNHQPIE